MDIIFQLVYNINMDTDALIEFYFSKSLDTTKDIKDFLTKVYTISNHYDNKNKDTYSSVVTKVEFHEYPEKPVFIVHYEIYKNQKLLKKSKLEILYPNSAYAYKKNKIEVTVARIDKVIKIYKNGIAANLIYINIETNEVTIGNFLVIKDIDFAKKLLDTRKLSKEDFEKYIERKITLKSKIEYYNEYNKKRFEELPELTEKWVLDEIKKIPINEKVFCKMKVVLKKENINPSLNAEFINNLLEIYKKKLDPITPLDIKHIDFDKELLNYLIRNKQTIIAGIHAHIEKGELYENTITAFIKKHLTGQKNTIQNMQQAQNTTPLTELIQGSKVYFIDSHDTSMGEKIPVNMDNMMGIIDPVHTHEAKANVDNKFTNAISFTDGEMFIKVFDKNFVELTIPITEYMTSAVMTYEHIDYRIKKIIKTNDDVYNCYLFGEYTLRHIKEIKYLRHQDSLVSKSTQLIPFINKTYVGRQMYGALQYGQSVPTKSSNVSIISTGNEKNIYNETTSHIKAPVSGTIINYKDDVVIIQSDDGEEHKIEVKLYKETMNHSFNKYIPRFKIGEHVEKDQNLFTFNTFKEDGSIALTTPTLTMIGTYYSMENNDSSVVSESYAKKLMHEEQDVIDIVLYKDRYKLKINEYGKDIFEKLGLPKIGTKIKQNEELFSYGVIEDTEESDIYNKITNKKLIKTKIFYVPFEIYEGTITKIEFLGLKPINNEYTKYFKELDSACFSYKRSLLGKSYKPNSEEFKDSPAEAVIRIYVEYWRNLTAGSKLSLLNGNKNTVSNILPDNQMPKLKDGRIVDLVISPLAEIPRMLGSQPYYLYLGKIAFDLHKKLEKGEFNNDIKDALEYLYPMEKVIDPQKILKKYGSNGYLRFTFPPYDTTLTEEKLLWLLEKSGLNQKEKVYDPIGKVWIRGLVDVGYLDVMLLHIMASKKLKITPTVVYTDSARGYGNLRGISGEIDGMKYGETGEFGQSISETGTALTSHGAIDEYKTLLRSRNVDPSTEIIAAFDQLLMRLE